MNQLLRLSPRASAFCPDLFPTHHQSPPGRHSRTSMNDVECGGDAAGHPTEVTWMHAGPLWLGALRQADKSALPTCAQTEEKITPPVHLAEKGIK
ncbi:hypothetical protein H920_13165 [Fukomys damarensis]|uniref:Uncharacterized protein n=1 Tax=Fukomys damarensis TaxID=885580 RepID=A0A091CZZ0_FUKDA|nr:hypothetical protein H920_13165 [Fukomys damarensis]